MRLDGVRDSVWACLLVCPLVSRLGLRWVLVMDKMLVRSLASKREKKRENWLVSLSGCMWDGYWGDMLDACLACMKETRWEFAWVMMMGE